MSVRKGDSQALSVENFSWVCMLRQYMQFLNCALKNICMVINQSAGQFAPNSMIKHENIKGFPLDNMRHLGAGLLAHH
jgi:hypothetical protein